MDLDHLVALPILSVRQPWAAYLVSGFKSIELRTWSTDYRGWMWIHAGKQFDAGAMEIYQLAPQTFRRGGLVGIAELRSCALIETPAEWSTLRNEHRSPGSFGPGIYGWRFGDAISLTDMIDVRGQLHLFHLDAGSRRRVREHLEKSPLHVDFVEAVEMLPSPHNRAL